MHPPMVCAFFATTDPLPMSDLRTCRSVTRGAGVSLGKSTRAESVKVRDATAINTCGEVRGSHNRQESTPAPQQRGVSVQYHPKFV